MKQYSENLDSATKFTINPWFYLHNVVVPILSRLMLAYDTTDVLCFTITVSCLTWRAY